MKLSYYSTHLKIRNPLKVEFARQNITSYSGLELFRRYFDLIGLHFRLRRTFRKYDFRGSYSLASVVLVFIAVWLSGGRRLSHIAWLQEDPLVQRFCSLKRLPDERTMSRWLKQMGFDFLQTLISFNSEIVVEKLAELELPRITLDFDGSTISCGHQVEGAARGYNPMNRHAKSYYPFLCHVAQTGHFLFVHNRSGNTHDSKGGALGKIKAAIFEIRSILPEAIIEVRLDSAFFQREIAEFLLSAGVEFAIKVPIWNSAEFKGKIQQRKRWQKATKRLSYFQSRIYIKKWDRHLDVIFFRKKISDRKTVKNIQLNLFSPDDGVYEYEILWTNKTTQPKTTLDFYNGRCAMEKQIGEWKQEFGLDAVPTNSLAANSAHQQISMMAYNLVRNFQMDVLQPKSRPQSYRRTGVFEFLSLKSLRFRFIHSAGQLLTGHRLRLNHNFNRQQAYKEIQKNLDQMAA